MEFKADQIIFNEGDSGNEMFYILEGDVIIEKNVEGRSIEVARLKQGDIFGEMALISEKPRTASAVTATDVRLLVIKKDNFASKMSENPDFAFHVTKSLAKRLEATTDELIMLKYVISG